MKRIFYIFIPLALLVACTNSTSLNATNTPQATFTFTPTFTPTITPTITSTPSVTPDPNKPFDATDKDLSTGEYTKTVEENGKTVVYVWKQFQFGDDSKNGITGHWFKSWMANGPINLTGYGETCKEKWGGTLDLNMNVYAIEGQPGLDKIGYIFHPDRETDWNKYQDEMDGGLSCQTINLFLGNSIMYDLFLRYINLLPSDSSKNKYLRMNDYYWPDGNITGEGGQKYSDDRQAFLKALNNGEMAIKIDDDEWLPNKGYEVYWINEDMAVNDPSMVVSPQAGTLKDYYLKVIVQDGKLIAFIAPAKWLKDQLLRPKVKEKECLIQ